MIREVERDAQGAEISAKPPVECGGETRGYVEALLVRIFGDGDWLRNGRFAIVPIDEWRRLKSS